MQRTRFNSFSILLCTDVFILLGNTWKYRALGLEKEIESFKKINFSDIVIIKYCKRYMLGNSYENL